MDRDEMRAAVGRLARLAKEATNGWASYARTRLEHAELARLHAAIDEANSRAVELLAREQALTEALSDMTGRMDFHIRARHKEAHNGDVYRGGTIDECPLCAETRKAIATAQAMLPPAAAPENASQPGGTLGLPSAPPDTALRGLYELAGELREGAKHLGTSQSVISERLERARVALGKSHE